ncbi:hypothetical protein J2S92_003455 [Arthrobacter bambusae]|nr:hypothetical protein [Arthrobacter bambusae]MDQ0237105.1 hypothetical protein [Arthrobacter bambusae]
MASRRDNGLSLVLRVSTQPRTHWGSVLAYSRKVQPIAFLIKNSGAQIGVQRRGEKILVRGDPG